MIRFAVVNNNYQITEELSSKIRSTMNQYGFEEDIVNPEYIFVIGGDGTLLSAVNNFQDLLDDACFIVIKSGTLGFYSNYGESTVQEVIDDLINDTVHLEQLPLLEVHYNDDQIKFALNEIKVIDHVKTIRTKVYINDELLQEFRGSGLVFATASGSTGFMRSIHGAIIGAEKYRLWEMQEMAAICNSTFSTINSAIILDDQQSVFLEGQLKNKKIIIDTFEHTLTNDFLTINLSNKNLNLVYPSERHRSKVEKLKSLLAHSGN